MADNDKSTLNFHLAQLINFQKHLHANTVQKIFKYIVAGRTAIYIYRTYARTERKALKRKGEREKEKKEYFNEEEAKFCHIFLQKKIVELL